METYLHRIGRTGRFGKKGIAINFVDCADSLKAVKTIQVGNFFHTHCQFLKRVFLKSRFFILFFSLKFFDQ